MSTATRTLNLQVGADVTDEQAIAALKAHGLAVEERSVLLHYITELGAQPYFTAHDWVQEHSPYQGLIKAIYYLAATARDGGITILDNDHTRTDDRERVAEQLRELLVQLAPDGLQLRGFLGQDPTRPLFVFDDVTLRGDLQQAADDCDAYDIPPEIVIAAGEDLVNEQLLELVWPVDSLTWKLRTSALSLG